MKNGFEFKKYSEERRKGIFLFGRQINLQDTEETEEKYTSLIMMATALR